MMFQVMCRIEDIRTEDETSCYKQQEVGPVHKLVAAGIS